MFSLWCWTAALSNHASSKSFIYFIYSFQHDLFELTNKFSDSILYLDIFLSFQAFQQRIAPLQGQVDNVNDQANQLQASEVVLSSRNIQQLEDFNTR